ncbi:AN1-type zinc finger protein 2A isoform X2 [Nematostella vectensis]|nr:AN1-type zinc finger protein 2A isoform X2 [Nematostella vectensis]
MADESDLLSLGRHCSVEWCKQLDFLPFKCSHCKQEFCLEHRLPDEHACREFERADAQVPVCPLCNKKIKKSFGDDLNTQVERHLLSGCKDLILRKAKKTNRCSLRSCHKSELLPLNCNQCGKQFCIR